MQFVILIIVCLYLYTWTHRDNELCKRQKEILQKDARPKPTVVTAFYDIGTFFKGTTNVKRTPDDYINWMTAFSFLNNDVVFYTDSIKYSVLFKSLRKNLLNITKVVYKSRKELWPFTILPKIRSVFMQDGYPRFYPNTVIPDYSAIQHSKYALLEHAINYGYVDTEYICWIDIGAFRDIAGEKRHYHLELPPELDDSMIGFNWLYQVHPLTMKTEDIFLQNRVWVAGNAFVGHINTMKHFCVLYNTSVSYFLSKGLANTDQQVLNAMFTFDTMQNLNVDILLQLYDPSCNIPFCPDKWFYRAYLMYKEDN